MRRIKWETNRCWEQKRNFVSPKAFKWGKTLFIVCSGSPGAFSESTEKIVLSAQKATHADLKREEKKLLDMLVCSLHGKMTLRDIKLYKCGYLSRADARWIRRALKQTFSSFDSSKVSERDLMSINSSNDLIFQWKFSYHSITLLAFWWSYCDPTRQTP